MAFSNYPLSCTIKNIQLHPNGKIEQFDLICNSFFKNELPYTCILENFVR